MFNFTPLYDIVSVSAGTLDDFENWKPTLEQYCIRKCVYRVLFLKDMLILRGYTDRADFLEKSKTAEKRYIESIAGDLEKDESKAGEGQ
jgi:hypothetical protein